MTNLVSPELSFHDGNTIPAAWLRGMEGRRRRRHRRGPAGLRRRLPPHRHRQIYGNEEGVGRAIAATDVPREDMFITTKVWNADQGFEETLAAFDASMERLGLEYLDLYLIHWLQPKQGKYVDTWRR